MRYRVGFLSDRYVAYFSLLAGLVLLVVGADALVRGSVHVAQRMGISSLLIGLTLVAWGTSAPELVVSARASLADQGGLSLGNAVGSNIVNLSVILGLTALIRPLRVASEMAEREFPLLIVVTLATTALIVTSGLLRWEGVLLLAVLIVWTLWQIRSVRQAAPELTHVDDIIEVSKTVGAKSTWTNVVFIVVGLGALVGGSSLFVGGASDLATAWGWSEALIGLTVVAVGTSLPELATSVAGVLKGEGDLAIGNVVGSNLFNLTGVLGIAAVVRPVPGGLLLPIDLIALVALTLLAVLALRTGFRLGRIEGALLLAGYAGYVVLRMG